MTTNEFLKELGVPAVGNVCSEPINCGAGLEIETENGSFEDSFMLLSGGVSESMFREFLGALLKSGRKETFHRERNGNIFAEFSGGEKKLVYTYYTAEKHEARVILDAVSLPLREYDDNEDDVRGDTALMQFSLRYGKMIRFVSCDCGMLYVLRLRDNSVIIVDGGEIEQATEDACDEIMCRLRDLTNTKDGEKIRVAAWFCTHNHDDHMDVFLKLLKREKDVLVVERVFYNFASRTLFDYDNPCTDKMKRRIKEFAPNAKYLKLHTGQTVRFPDATFEVLSTHEDILPHSTRSAPENVYRGMNETTTIVQITFDDCSVIFLGDAEESNGEALISLYGKNSLFCTYLQCAHHLINDDRNIYGNVKAKKLLIPQCRYIAVTTERENTNYLTSLFGEENMYYAGDCTHVFTVRNGEPSITYFEQKGYFYDNSETLD
mgnify:CR=1 FL=1